MSEAERQAQAAGKFNEAAAMRRVEGQAGGDLERIVSVMQAQYEDLNWALGEMEAAEDSKVREYWATGPVDGAAKAMARQCRLNWPAIRAALARERELREALGEVIDASKH